MPPLGNLKSAALGLMTNLRGWKTRRKLVVIESDDWGAIRMPSKTAWDSLREAGVQVDRSAFDIIDCLETRQDLDFLLNELEQHVDSNGNRPVITCNMVLGNPDFERIEQAEFEEYHHRDLWDSYFYYHGERLEDWWSTAIQSGRIRPQFHAYEHLNVPLWMRDLKGQKSATRIAFDHGFFGLTTETSSSVQRNYLAAYWAESEADLLMVLNRLDQGLARFREIFRHSSKTFVACNYILPVQAESRLLKLGVKSIQSQRGQFVPNGTDHHGRVLRSFTGQRSSLGLLRTVRNVLFEPFLGGGVNWLGSSLSQINASFLLGKPAVISTHRANYVSGLSSANRDKNLKTLGELLKKTLNRWPDVEFISSEQLCELIIGEEPV